MNRRDFLLAASGAFAGALPTLRQDGRVSKTGAVAHIPFAAGAGQIELPVSVNGQPPVTFLVDTGAEYSIISAAMADRLRLTTARRGSRDFADGVSLEFGGLLMAAQRVMVMPFDGYRAQGRAIEGIIGYDFFARYVVTIDFQSKTMMVWEPDRFEHPPGVVRVPLEFVRRLPVVAVEIEFAARNWVKTRLLLDTGASQTVMLRHPFAMNHRLFELAPDAATHTAGSLASGTLRLVRLPARRLRFASWTLDQPFIRAHREPVGSGAYTDTDGVLGNEVLRRFHIVVDYPQRLMTLQPNSSLREPFNR